MGVRLYVYPGLDPKNGQRIDLASFDVPGSVSKLLDYLVDQDFVRPLDGVPDSELRIRSDDILAMLRSGDHGWESHVEPEVGAAIKSGGLFGYKA